MIDGYLQTASLLPIEFHDPPNNVFTWVIHSPFLWQCCFFSDLVSVAQRAWHKEKQDGQLTLTVSYVRVLVFECPPLSLYLFISVSPSLSLSLSTLSQLSSNETGSRKIIPLLIITFFSFTTFFCVKSKMSSLPYSLSLSLTHSLSPFISLHLSLHLSPPLSSVSLTLILQPYLICYCHKQTMCAVLLKLHPR